MREYNSAFFREFSPVKGAILSGIARICFQSIRKLVSTEREREREATERTLLCKIRGFALVEKADLLDLLGTKGSARRRKRGGRREGGRKERTIGK